jgi:hypothetical protein
MEGGKINYLTASYPPRDILNTIYRESVCTLEVKAQTNMDAEL